MAKKQESAIDGAELITEVLRLELRAGDTLVFRTDAPIRPEWKIYLEKQLRAQFPDNNVLVIDRSFDLFVLAGAELAETEGATSDPD